MAVTPQEQAGEWTLEKALALYPPQKIGPTWVVSETGHWLLPERTLGWEVLGFVTEWLLAPDGSGQPFELTNEQARFILWYYAIDEHGNFLYPNGVLQRCKGWGKDPLSAALAIVELCGPCRFGGWDEDGDPIGIPVSAPLVQIAAVSKDQTQNTRDLFPVIIPKRTADHFNLDVQTELIYAKGRGKLQVISSNPRTAEGGRVTWALGNETHHWNSGNGADRFYLTLMNNLRKVGGRFLAITNAYQPGEDSVAENIREAQQRVWDGLAAPNGWLYDSLEAHPKAPLDLEVAPFILQTVMGDAWWLKKQIPSVVESFTDTSIPPSQQRRMWYNAIVSTEESVFTADEIEDITDHTMTGTVGDLKPGDRITLGFDGGRTDDATALIAYRLSDKCFIPIQIWERPTQSQAWEISAEDVDSMVGWVFTQFKVVGFYADVSLWESYIATWSDQYREHLLIRASPKSSIGYDMSGHRKDIQTLNETMIGLVRDKKLKTNGHARLRTHFLNAERRWGGGFLSFGKKGGRESSRKIDGLIAASLALKAALDLAESGKDKIEKNYNRRLYQW